VVAIRSWLAVVWLAAPIAAFAQAPDTRAGEIAQQQEAKARDVKPYAGNVVQRRLLEIEEAGGLAMRRGLYVTFGDIKHGSSFAAGPAYTKLFDNGAMVTAKGTYSIRNFKLFQLAADLPPLANRRLRLSGRARWQDAPQLAVYPLGTEAPKTRADYSETKLEVSGQAELRPVSFVRVGGGVALERFDTGGADTAHPSVEELFTPAEMPGLSADPTYLHSFAAAGLDSGAGRGYSRSGSLLQATLHDYRQRDDGPYSFQRVDAIARQLIPILHGNWVIDLSVRTSTTSVSEGNQVPFFLLPELGGAGDLRGYPAYRFRDRHSIVFTGEYRWYVQEFVDMAVFYDAGKVTSSRSDLDFDNLRSDVGIGIRFHGPETTAIRIELAKGDEGLRFNFGFSAPIK
jgi:hypothetical protein